MKILTFKKFNEANGVELLNPGLNGNSLPNFPSTEKSPMSRFGNIDTTVIEDKDGNFYFYDQFQKLYLEFGKDNPELSVFNKLNLDKLIQIKNSK